jgi:ketosteroid isomerase-like protein
MVAKQYNDDFNKGDTKAAVALCTGNAVIIDDFPPHAWQGANTCSDWFAALATYKKSAGITNEKVTLGKPWHVTVTGDRAYAVYPTHYTYMLNGKKVTEQDVWTFAMQKTDAGWRVAGWAWASKVS